MPKSQFTTQLIANIIFRIKRKGFRSPQVKLLIFTGTVGKTTLRDAVAFGLKSKGYKVESNNLGYSNEVGILLTILGVEKFSAKNLYDWLKVIRARINEEKFACVELGADFYRDIPWFLKRLKPTAVFISGIAEKDWTDKAESISNDRKKLLRSVPKSGFIVYNVDDSPTKRLVEISGIKAKKTTFSLKDKSASIYAKDWSKNIFSLPLEKAFHKEEFVDIIYNDRLCRVTINRPLFEPQIYA